MKYFQQMKEKAIELKEKDEILILAIESPVTRLQLQ